MRVPCIHIAALDRMYGSFFFVGVRSCVHCSLFPLFYFFLLFAAPVRFDCRSDREKVWCAVCVDKILDHVIYELRGDRKLNMIMWDVTCVCACVCGECVCDLSQINTQISVSIGFALVFFTLAGVCPKCAVCESNDYRP